MSPENSRLPRTSECDVIWEENLCGRYSHVGGHTGLGRPYRSRVLVSRRVKTRRDGPVAAEAETGTRRLYTKAGVRGERGAAGGLAPQSVRGAWGPADTLNFVGKSLRDFSHPACGAPRAALGDPCGARLSDSQARPPLPQLHAPPDVLPSVRDSLPAPRVPPVLLSLPMSPISACLRSQVR